LLFGFYGLGCFLNRLGLVRFYDFLFLLLRNAIIEGEILKILNIDLISHFLFFVFFLFASFVFFDLLGDFLGTWDLLFIQRLLMKIL
jgi:hypothetical protein